MKKKILFVCVENSNRSQMAQAFANMLGGEHVEAFSAGSNPSGKINPKAIDSMNELGYDLSKHQSKSLEAVKSNAPFDVVVTMGCGDACPWMPAKKFIDWQIPDPRNMEPEEFRQVRDLVRTKVEEVVGDLITISPNPHLCAMKIDTIIFDLGGVLIDWNPDYVYRTIFEDEEKMRWFYQNICTPDWNEQQDAGRSLKEATEELITRFPEHEQNIRAYYDRWEEMLGGPIEGTVEVLRKLKYESNCKLYALTNWSHETFPVALDRYEFLHWFDGRIVSGEEKTRKPFLKIYQLLIDRFGIEPTTAIYIDDNARNLEPAAQLGFKTIHFKSPEQLAMALKDYQVLNSKADN